jgi:hypothetical protein
VITDGGTYKGAQTEIRGGYETKVGTSGLKVYGEVGPGYEWNNGGTNEGVVVTEVGLSYPLSKQVSVKAKVAGEYGFDSEAFDLGGEVKVRYSFLICLNRVLLMNLSGLMISIWNCFLGSRYQSTIKPWFS